jgi:hypothetical protein
MGLRVAPVVHDAERAGLREMFGGSRNVAIVLMSIKAIRVPHRMDHS